MVTTACGPSPTPGEKALHTAQDRLTDINSGTLDFTMLASSSESAATSGVGFTVAGPFAVARTKGELPRGDLSYTRITGTNRSTTRVLTTARHAYAYVDGNAYQLADAQVKGLRSNGGGDGGGLEGLDFTDWLSKPVVKAGPVIDGVATQSISGTVDSVGALNDILGLAQEFGSSAKDYPDAIASSDKDAVRSAVRGVDLQLLVGKSDHLLRRFRLAITMAVSKQDRLRAALKRLAGVQISMDLAVKRVNRPVRISAPAHPRPASALPTS